MDPTGSGRIRTNGVTIGGMLLGEQHPRKNTSFFGEFREIAAVFLLVGWI